jgi:hypothetical protein
MGEDKKVDGMAAWDHSMHHLVLTDNVDDDELNLVVQVGRKTCHGHMQLTQSEIDGFPMDPMWDFDCQQQLLLPVLLLRSQRLQSMHPIRNYQFVDDLLVHHV